MGDRESIPIHIPIHIQAAAISSPRSMEIKLGAEEPLKLEEAK
jgi:hypothetical protein